MLHRDDKLSIYYLLQTSFEALKDMKQVEKTVFGREGANTKIINPDGSINTQTDGPYDNYKKIYQEYIEFFLWMV